MPSHGRYDIAVPCVQPWQHQLIGLMRTGKCMHGQCLGWFHEPTTVAGQRTIDPELHLSEVAMAIVYRFQTWDITNDCFQVSQRWATKDMIEQVQGEIVSQGVEIADSLLGKEVPGMTARGIDPQNPPETGFQTRVRK